jgi:hypothetical protein
LEDDLKGYLPRGADLLDTHRMSVKLLEVELASSTDRIDDVVYEQMQAVADRYLAMGSARIYHNDAARQATCAAADCYRMCCDYAASAVAASTAARAAFIKDTAASATDFAKAANAASDASKQMMEAARYRAVWNQILRRVRAESSRRPPRHRRDACSMAWQCRFLTARRSQRGHVIAEK